MSPLTPPVLTRLDPRYPVLWRDERTVQFGLDDRVRVHVDADWVEPLLGRLRSGIRRGSFDVVAHGVGAPRQAARRLFELLRPVLVDDMPPAPPVWLEGVNIADGRALERLRDALADEGVCAGERTDTDAVGVIVVEGAAAALQFAAYLRDDVAHLPVAFERDAATIGPLVIPGETPCLSCRDAHESARDPAWPMLHAQLIGRPSGRIAATRVAGAAELVTRILRTPTPAAGLMVRVSPDGRRSWRSVRHHADCPCLEPLSRSRRESETPVALPVRRIATTTPPAFARPA